MWLFKNLLLLEIYMFNNKSVFMENKFTLASLCLLMGMGTAFAQNTQVKGNVVDEKGEPVIGASIVVKGTTVGTVTDFDGNFILEVPSNGKELEISYIGMEKQTVKVASNINVKMVSDTQALDEVMVVAYNICDVYVFRINRCHGNFSDCCQTAWVHGFCKIIQISEVLTQRFIICTDKDFI